MPYVEVWVDDAASLEDATDKDLLDELRRRNLPTETDGAKEDLERVFYALYFGKESEALALMRSYVQNVTGKILP